MVKRGLSGRLFGGGTVVLNLTTGSRVVIADLGEPDEAKREVERAISESPGLVGRFNIFCFNRENHRNRIRAHRQSL